MTHRLNIVVADDHPIFRAATLHVVQDMLSEDGVIEVASQSALETAVADGRDIDLVLLDLMMPGAIGFSSLLLLRSERPELPVIVISSNDHPRTVYKARQFGAAGFVSKAAPADVLRDAVRTVMEGGLWFSHGEIAGDEGDAELASQLAQLTPAQLRVLMLVAEGLSNKQIALLLGLAENTVKIHVTAVLGKLECRSRVQAALLVQALHLEAGKELQLH